MTFTARPQPTTLYRLFDDPGALLYVGIAGNPGRRFEQHRTEKPWWGEVAHITVEHFPSREAALEAEWKAIQAENPRHNIAGRATPARPLRQVPPEWEHRSLCIGAYLDIERTPAYTAVRINRDQAVDIFGPGHRVPEQVLQATERASRAGVHRLWAEGCAREEFPISVGHRFRGVHVPYRFEDLAIEAMLRSEMDADISGLERLALALETGELP